MNKMKKLSAALLAALMVVSMLSCMVVNVSAAQFDLGGPVTIEKMPLRGESTGSGIVVGGEMLSEPNVLVVNADWAKAKGTQPIKLGGVVYNVTMGVNGFASLAAAMDAADGHETIYVAAGVYEDAFTQTVGNLKIYGPKAGINPNNAEDRSKPNTKRPAAVGLDAPTDDEAVLTGGMSYNMSGSNLVFDGFYLGGGFSFSTDGSMSGNNNYRYGTFVKNCVVNTTAGNLFNHPAGNSPNMEISNLRVLSGKNLVLISGMMDIRVFNNYLNLSGNTIETRLVCAGSMGSYALIENNYYEYSGGNVYKYDHEQQTAVYTAIVRNNYIADMGPAAMVHNTFFAAHTLPGTNLQITNNKVMKIDEGQTLFEFPFVENQTVDYEFPFMININENYFDLPAGNMFVKSEMNGSLNLANNYYASPISVDRVTKGENSQVILYPYYADEAMTQLVGGFSKVMPNAEIDYTNKLITIDLFKGGDSLDKIEMDKALKVDEGCSWKLFKERTLEKEIADKIAYPAAGSSVSQYFAAVYAPNGELIDIYEIRLLSGDGTKAHLIDVVIDNVLVPKPVITGKTFTYTFPKNVAFADYELKVSSGATYELYADYDQQGNKHVALEDIGNYIPYGGYQFDVVIKAQNSLEEDVYTVVFNRERSEAFDPSLIGGNAPSNGKFSVLRNGALQFASYELLVKATFDLEATPGATYTILKEQKDKDGKTVLDKDGKIVYDTLSTSEELKEIELQPGDNEFVVEVKDGKHTNMIPFYVRNEGKSSVAEIIGMTGLSPIINNNVITVQSGGDNISVAFNTSDPYAVVEVYADPARKVALTYTSNPVEVEPNRFFDERTFALDIKHATSKYYLNCIAENGKVNQYDLIITKLVKANEYTDVVADSWYEDYVKAASESGILQGSKNGETFIFRPNANTSRQEMAVVASRLIGINTAAFEKVELPFKDADTISAWALGNVKVAYAMGVMNGSKDAAGLNFRPKSDISRQEVIAMFVRMFKLSGKTDLNAFADAADVSNWAKPEMEAAVASGLIEGSNGKLNPKKPITRAELAAMIARV